VKNTNANAAAANLKRIDRVTMGLLAVFVKEYQIDHEDTVLNREH
jgi:hypothetical protein